MAADAVVPRLDEQLCFALHAASRAVTGLYRPLLDDLGLTYPQYLVMLSLWEHGDRGVKELGQALCVDSGTLSPLLKRLEKAGLVRRERRGDDERSVRVTLTEEGDRLRAKAVSLPGVVGEAMGLGPAQIDELRTTLHQLTDSVNRYRANLDG
ncbi:MarR family winged helix-turn-helix transcriptional regulator [Qaidamihabitans albus]|uniref:MarR family winged helix-turn-helix transcriptional regulator n=1 Tax=Qaidamihabitans albus TaxID=2795733 RepID=UPI0018F232E7|nr:MarR family transcriptional regulator [Qaidamihabitans albus]